jgi:hypothetical protein
VVTVSKQLLGETGVGRLVVLGAIVYLAKFQSVPLAILLAIYYVKACRAAYSEGFEAEEKKEDKKEEKGGHDEWGSSPGFDKADLAYIQGAW